MGKLKSFEELTSNRKQIELDRRERMQEMYDYVKERGDLRKEELKQLKVEDRRIYKEMRQEIKEYANNGVNKDVEGMTENQKTIICIVIVAIMISFVGMFITGWVELLFATIFTGLCIMIGMAIIDNTNGRTEKIIAEREKKVREYRFAPEKLKIVDIEQKTHEESIEDEPLSKLLEKEEEDSYELRPEEIQYEVKEYKPYVDEEELDHGYHIEEIEETQEEHYNKNDYDDMAILDEFDNHKADKIASEEIAKIEEQEYQ